MLLLPVGSTIELIAFPEASVGALVKTYDTTVKSALVIPAPTVYTPVSVAPDVE